MDKPVRTYCIVSIVALLVQWLIFRFWFPFPGFYSDSYTYIGAAIDGSAVSIRPIGYSWFLTAIHAISTSAGMLIFLQYLLIEAAAFWLFLNIRRIFPLSPKIEWIFFIFLICNPLSLFVANSVSSDALFTALGLCWLVTLLRLVEKPRWSHIIVLSILLLLVFYVRYNALCYPVIAAVAFFTTIRRKGWIFAATGIIASLCIVLMGVLLTREATYRRTGTRVFTAFSAWQIANNALHVYPYIEVDNAALPGADMQELDKCVKAYFDTAGPRLRAGNPTVTADYMWNMDSPLKYYYSLIRNRDHSSHFVAWTKVAPLYTRYGYYLILRHPFLFTKYYLLPGTAQFFWPPLEVLGNFNDAQPTIDPAAQSWFHFESPRVYARWTVLQPIMMSPYRILYLLENILCVLAILHFCLYRNVRKRILAEYPSFFRAWIVISTFFAVNAGFFIYAAANFFRYQVIPFLVLMPFIVIYASIVLRPKDSSPPDDSSHPTDSSSIPVNAAPTE